MKTTFDSSFSLFAVPSSHRFVGPSSVAYCHVTSLVWRQGAENACAGSVPVDACCRFRMSLRNITVSRVSRKCGSFATARQVCSSNSSGIWTVLMEIEISRQLGFLRFRNLDYSRDFVEQNFPAIYLYGNNPSNADDRGAKVRIAYSREREDRNRSRGDSEWTCSNVGWPAAVY